MNSILPMDSILFCLLLLKMTTAPQLPTLPQITPNCTQPGCTSRSATSLLRPQLAGLNTEPVYLTSCRMLNKDLLYIREAPTQFNK